MTITILWGNVISINYLSNNNIYMPNIFFCHIYFYDQGNFYMSKISEKFEVGK